MALTPTARGGNISTANNVSLAVSNVAAGALLVVACGGNEEDSSPVTTTVSDTTGLTWTLRASATVSGTASPVWSGKVYIYTAQVGGSIISPTITAANSQTMDGTWLHVMEYSGHDAADPVGATATGTRQETTGSWTINLSANPASDSEVVAAGTIDNYVNSNVWTNGPGWTQRYENSISETHAHVQTRTGSTSTSVTWDNADAETGDDYGFGAVVAIEIKAASAGEEYTLSAEGGTYTISGTSASLEFGRVLVSQTGSYAISGTSASLEYGRAVAAEAGSYAINGVEVTFLRTWAAAAEPGSYTLSGTTAGLERGYTLAAEAGSYALSGSDAGFSRGYGVSAAPGAYAVTGSAASLEHDCVLSAAAGAYALSGINALLERGYGLTAEAASYAITGVDAGLEYGRVIAADGGAYQITGEDAGLTHIAGLGLVAGSGSYALAGTQSGMLLFREILAQGGTYEISGTDAECLLGADGSNRDGGDLPSETARRKKKPLGIDRLTPEELRQMLGDDGPAAPPPNNARKRKVTRRIVREMARETAMPARQIEQIASREVAKAYVPGLDWQEFHAVIIDAYRRIAETMQEIEEEDEMLLLMAA